MTQSDPTATTLLLKTAIADPKAADALVELLFDELRAIAKRLLDREHPGHTLQPTALVNELYLKLIDQSQVESNSRAHFLCIAARAMRQILVNHARGKSAQKRGGGWQRLPMHLDIAEGRQSQAAEIVALDEALEKLGRQKARIAQVVEMRFFAGMTVDEVAIALDISPRTVAIDWDFASAWLSRELSDLNREAKG
jgi:RNA polymerase sigma factor (TIGR02999 family)